MRHLNKLYQEQPYSLKKNEKNKIFSAAINNLTKHHYKKCKLYKKIVNNLNFKIKKK